MISLLAKNRWTLALALCLLAAPGPALGGEPDERPADSAAASEAETDASSATLESGAGSVDAPEVLFEQLLVVGAPEQARRVPGSAHVITREEIERQAYADVHRVLRQTPGLNIQEEDGFGLRPNIGIRGTGVERSQKITLLEDGVLIAPAPYAAPSAYYSPTAGRMEGFEIRKGSGAIRQGPHTNGGAINYLSKSIPQDLEGRLSLSAGEEGLLRTRASLGDSTERFGWLVESFRHETEGFKRIDGNPSADTGFDLEDTMAKLRWNSPLGTRRFQALELKLGRTEQAGNETYLGLTREDFARDPYRRYAASAGDQIVTDHEQFQLSYYLEPGARWNLTGTVYRNDFFRNWFKLERVNGVGVASVLAEADRYASSVSVLRGETDSAPGALEVRNNRRDYFSEGLQVVLGVDVSLGSVEHSLDIGLRRHRDQEDRFQENEFFQMLDGRRVLSSVGAPGSNANRIASAEATAVFLQDTFTTGRWTWTPGVRIESIDLERRDFGRADPDRTGDALALRENSLTEVIPGLGVGYRLDDRSNLFFGVHRGFSPPSPSSTQEVDAESSVNYELGWRYSSGDVSGELVGFFNDYQNLLGSDTLSGGGQGTGDQFNGGRVEVRGLEAGMTVDLAPSPRARLSWPLRLAYTYTAGEFRNAFESDFSEWGPRVARGDRLPYLPEHQLHAGLSAEALRWSLHLDGSYSAAMRTRPGSGPIPAEAQVESRVLFDLRAEVRVTERVKAWGQVLNLTDEVYVAARRPAGLRPGRPRAVLFGFSVDFAGEGS